MNNTPSIIVPPQDGRHLSIEAIIQYGKLQGRDVFYRLLREKRNAELKASDWSVVADTPLNEQAKERWIQYRQALRDVPQNIESEDDIVWPSAP